MKLKALIALTCVTVALAACSSGGGNDDDVVVIIPPPTEAIPASASASSAGFIAYLKALIVSAADTLEPLALGDFVAPISEIAEPEAI